ncbi:MarR family winged helix-turn-helix transcriptional regulator [Tsukamurella spumae]|uniref:MarR family transcriptional regulator n=1 Tax=Tsukamurella spumae TaxID=44753 RepID=A0A846X439_9ACTN|nr:MarR family transcriptional regulator [Tsukamurella spumae]NKY20258.1 MarR family transcriptional regulator [Tsukamurella spumae]
MQATPVDVTADALTEVFSEFMGRLMCNVTQESLGTMLSSDITAHQFHILLQLAASEAPLPINRLADYLGLSVAATGRNVEKLVQLDMVDRREDSSDRRIKNLTITDLGRKTVASAVSDKHREVLSFAERLPVELRNRLHDVMVEILDTGLIPPNPFFTAMKENA